MAERLSFTELVEIEPRLGELLHEAREADSDPDGPYFCVWDVWGGKGRWEGRALKRQMIHLVGYNAGLPEPSRGGPPRTAASLVREWLTDCEQHRDIDERLITREAYDTAYRTIFDALPPCRGCACVPEEG